MAPLVSFEDVTVAYPLKEGGVHRVFANLNLQINSGEFVTVVGETGCGKSTLLKLLLGSEQPASGSVVVDGVRVTQPTRDRGYVPQKYSLFPDKTVIQNIAFGPIAETFNFAKLLQPVWWTYRKSIYSDAMAYLRRVGLRDRDANKYPDQLSGGMQQRVAIAQSLMLHPRILLMDESFSALDPSTRTAMQRLLRSIWAEHKMTIVFVTHNLAEAAYLGSRVLSIVKNEARQCSEVALDLQVPDYVRNEDGSPRTEQLEAVIHEVDYASHHHLLPQSLEQISV